MGDLGGGGPPDYNDHEDERDNNNDGGDKYADIDEDLPSSPVQASSSSTPPTRASPSCRTRRCSEPSDRPSLRSLQQQGQW